ncbi:MAG: hypothetical protein WC560_07770 [Syntrophales bacterium]
MLLLNGYNFTAGMCLVDPNKIRIIAELTDDIHEVLPYLNTVFRGCSYNHNTQNLILNKDGRIIVFYPEEITITNLENEDEGKEVLDRLKDLINKAYDNRESIKPKYDKWLTLSPLSLYSYFPNIKCEDCPGKGCYGFTIKLMNAEVNIAQCKPLFTAEFKEKRKELLAILENAGYDVPKDFL